MWHSLYGCSVVKKINDSNLLRFDGAERTISVRPIFTTLCAVTDLSPAVLAVRIDPAVRSRVRENFFGRTTNSGDLTGSFLRSTYQNERTGTTRTPEYKIQYGLAGISVGQVTSFRSLIDGCLYLYRICALANSRLSTIASRTLSCSRLLTQHTTVKQ